MTRFACGALPGALFSLTGALAVFGAGMSADLIIVNGTVRTMDPAQPAAEAVAVYRNRITAVGNDRAVRALAGSGTRVVDAGRRLVLPGFVDAHVHFLSGGFTLGSIDLRQCESPQEFARRLGEHAAKVPSRSWITGGHWDHERWPGAPLPTRGLIDPVTGDHPVFVRRLDGHMGLANSLALRLAGVTRDTPDPPGGSIVRDGDTGEPTGVLKDAAMSLVTSRIPQPSREARLEAARAATEEAARLGVTSVHDMSSDVGVYQELLERGELKTRIYAISPLPRWERPAAVGLRAGFGNPMLRVGGLKGFADGSLGSSTALFFDPYLDHPDTRGLPSDEMIPPEAMLERIRGADRAGLQVMVHAIGDRANHEVLSLFEKAAADSIRDRRFRIEHAQHLRRQDVARFARNGVIASMQPFHAADDGRWAEKRIGTERSRGTYAFRWLIDAGAILAFGSDWTVAPLDPMQGIATAVTRRTLDGRHPDGWIPEQKISVEEAVRAYTAGSAYAEFAENDKGTISVGKLADLVILDRDIFSVDPGEIEKAKVLTTIVDGRVVYESAPGK